ncbi:MAG: diphthine--ammonia ligase [Methanomassiliicoccales archaeon]|nr:diphthine--ammonia ligase [Methanomassiliicoccales archaeon]
MHLCALFSGGKDSTYAMYLMEQQGHRVDTLVSVIPAERDSWLFHTPNLNLLPLQAMAMQKRLLRAPSQGSEQGDLEALRQALSGLDVDGVVSGAIASDYQWDRINGVCETLGLRLFSPLWRKEQGMLLRDMIDAGVEATVVAVSAEGLGSEWLGRTLDVEAVAQLQQLAASKGVNPSGEGGEYETLVIDSPMHDSCLEIVEAEKEIFRDGGRLTVKRARLRGDD